MVKSGISILNKQAILKYKYKKNSKEKINDIIKSAAFRVVPAFGWLVQIRNNNEIQYGHVCPFPFHEVLQGVHVLRDIHWSGCTYSFTP